MSDRGLGDTGYAAYVAMTLLRSRDYPIRDIPGYVATWADDVRGDLGCWDAESLADLEAIGHDRPAWVAECAPYLPGSPFLAAVTDAMRGITEAGWSADPIGQDG